MRRGATLALLAAAAGCLGHGAARRASPRGASSGAPRAAIPGPPVRYAPGDDGAGAYGPTRQVTLSDPLADAAAHAVRQAATAAGRPVPERDARLDRAAGDLARAWEGIGPPPEGLVEFALRHRGLVEPPPQLMMIELGPAVDPGAIEAELRARAPAVLGEGEYNRIGVGVARAQDGERRRLVIALLEAYVELAAIPRAVPMGARVRLAGRLLGAYLEPQVFITVPGGSVVRAALRVEGRGHGGFRGELRCERPAGVRKVEVVAHGPRGASVLANFPLHCGGTPPREVAVPTTPPPAGPADPDAIERRLVTLINQDRVAAGLAPLAPLAPLAAAARDHSRDMLDHGFVGHLSPTTGSAADRARRGGVHATAILENVARDYGADEAHAGLMDSPGHRANVLSTLPTHVGVGVHLGRDVGGRRELLVTEMFAAMPRPISEERAPGELRRLIDRRRAGAHLRPVVPSADLDRLATDCARRLARGELRALELGAEITPLLRPLSRRFGRISTIATAALDLESLGELDAAADREVTHLGVGVARGPHPELGEQAAYVVVLLARAR